ncbi:unnamed protein product, partial [Closterium sp. Yama58-4]
VGFGLVWMGVEGGWKGSVLVMMYARHASELMVGAFKKEREKGGAAEGGVEEFDISGGKREALNKEAAEKLLAPLLKPNNGCKKVPFATLTTPAHRTIPLITPVLAIPVPATTIPATPMPPYTHTPYTHTPCNTPEPHWAPTPVLPTPCYLA